MVAGGSAPGMLPRREAVRLPHTGRHIRHTSRQAGRQSGGQAGTQAKQHAGGQSGRRAGTQAGRHTSTQARQAVRQAPKQAGRQAGRQAPRVVHHSRWEAPHRLQPLQGQGVAQLVLSHHQGDPALGPLLRVPAGPRAAGVLTSLSRPPQMRQHQQQWPECALPRRQPPAAAAAGREWRQCERAAQGAPQRASTTTRG